jgi:hypothetical protein
MLGKLGGLGSESVGARVYEGGHPAGSPAFGGAAEAAKQLIEGSSEMSEAHLIGKDAADPAGVR